MITFFTTPKPFRGHIAVMHRSAIQSWTRIHPSAEVILFGDEEGAAEAARDLRIRHVPEVKRNEHGTKYLSPIFDGAQDLAHHNCLCYINCDIILLSDFRVAVERVTALGGRFLMAGQRWDTDITQPGDFYAVDGTTGSSGTRGIPAPASWMPRPSSRLCTKTTIIPTIPAARPASGRVRKHRGITRCLNAGGCFVICIY